MIVEVDCPNCGKHLTGAESFAGRTVQCPDCSSKVTFPTLFMDEAPPAPQPVASPGPNVANGEGGEGASARGRGNKAGRQRGRPAGGRGKKRAAKESPAEPAPAPAAAPGAAFDPMRGQATTVSAQRGLPTGQAAIFLGGIAAICVITVLLGALFLL